VDVAAPIRLAANRQELRNKQKLVLAAYLPMRDIPPRSADVAFQVRIGDHWRTFATRSLEANGRAVAKHRFQVTFHAMTYRFRAVVVRHAKFPYANAASPTVVVKVN
jgi:hypothetical protein